MPLRVNSAWNSSPRHVPATCPLVWADLKSMTLRAEPFASVCSEYFPSGEGEYVSKERRVLSKMTVSSHSFLHFQCAHIMNTNIQPACWFQSCTQLIFTHDTETQLGLKWQTKKVSVASDHRAGSGTRTRDLRVSSPCCLLWSANFYDVPVILPQPISVCRFWPQEKQILIVFQALSRSTSVALGILWQGESNELNKQGVFTAVRWKLVSFHVTLFVCLARFFSSNVTAAYYIRT